MDTQWFLVPYEEDLNAKPMPRRWCAMDSYTAGIEADDGTWEEIEITGNRALVRVKAMPQTIAAIKFPKIPDAALNAQYRGKALKRIPPRFDEQTKKIVFDRPEVTVTKRVEDLEERIK